MRKISTFLVIFLFSIVCCFAQASENKNLKKVCWIFSAKDFDLNLKNEDINDPNHVSTISRKWANKTEKVLIRKAESLYPEEGEIITSYTTKNPSEYTEEVISPTIEESPFWSGNAFDRVKIAKILSGRAVIYYQKLSSEFRRRKTISIFRTNFSYSANVQHYDKYEIQGEKFKNVNVVFLEMWWTQFCGDTCGMGFDKEKVVIFSSDKEAIAMFVDLGNSGWVS